MPCTYCQSLSSRSISWIRFLLRFYKSLNLQIVTSFSPQTSSYRQLHAATSQQPCDIALKTARGNELRDLTDFLTADEIADLAHLEEPKRMDAERQQRIQNLLAQEL